MLVQSLTSASLPRPREEAAPDRPTVLFVGNFLSGSGLTPGVSEDIALRLRASGWSVLMTSDRRARLPRLWDTVRTIISRRRDYDLAHVDVFSGPGFALSEAACWALRRAGKPYVLTLHGGGLPEFSVRHPGRVRRLLESAERVTAPSEYLRSALKSYRADLELLPNPIDAWSYRYRSRADVQPRLIWVRAFHECYNPGLAPRVIAELTQAVPLVELTMLGPDKGDGSLQRMQQRARELHVAERIRTPGRVAKSDIPQWLDQADIFVNTTHVDNTPVSVLEAMAAGLCIVSTNVGGLPYLLRQDEDALLVPPDEPALMAAAVLRVLRDRNLAGRMSSAARRHALDHDWNGILPRWEQLLREVWIRNLCRMRRSR
jgi:glycosyltransferase involved in cell wall biosynthesis